MTQLLFCDYFAIEKYICVYPPVRVCKCVWLLIAQVFDAIYYRGFSVHTGGQHSWKCTAYYRRLLRHRLVLLQAQRAS